MSKTRPTFNGVGSLITYQDEGGSVRCLGYLVCFERHGVYDPSFGRVEVTPENAEIHNRLLDVAMLEGLDQNCEIGMGGSFYLGKQNGRLVIKTWCSAGVGQLHAERQQCGDRSRRQVVSRSRVAGARPA